MGLTAHIAIGASRTDSDDSIQSGTVKLARGAPSLEEKADFEEFELKEFKAIELELKKRELSITPKRCVLL